jgi:hypothetical protein
MDNNHPEGEVHPKDVLECMRNLPDEKVSAARILDEFDDTVEGFGDALSELIRLGEVELCQERGTGPRVWLKRRKPSDDTKGMDVSGFVWRCYVRGDNKHKADRLFESRAKAIDHLAQSAVVDPDSFETVPYLSNVWRASTSGFEGYHEMTAVVRREPIYSTPDRAPDRDSQGEQSKGQRKNSPRQQTFGEMRDGPTRTDRTNENTDDSEAEGTIDMTGKADQAFPNDAGGGVGVQSREVPTDVRQLGRGRPRPVDLHRERPRRPPLRGRSILPHRGR